MSYDSTLRALYVDTYFRCHQLMSSDKKQNFQKSFVFTPPDYKSLFNCIIDTLTSSTTENMDVSSTESFTAEDMSY